MALGQFATAEGLLNEYLGRIRDHPQATRLIARAALQQHAALRAIEYLKPLTEKLPPDAATLTLLGDAYMADGKPAMALEQFEKAAVLDPQSPAAKTRVAVAALGVG